MLTTWIVETVNDATVPVRSVYLASRELVELHVFIAAGHAVGGDAIREGGGAARRGGNVTRHSSLSRRSEIKNMDIRSKLVSYQYLYQN